MLNEKPKVILLVAGEGKRLHPYTSDRPKCMVEINNVSLIDRQIKILREAGLNNILMIGGYKSEMLKIDNVELKINPRYKETNMVYTLFTAEDDLEGEIIVSYGDIVYSKEILRLLLESKSDISVTIDKDWEDYWSARNENPLDDAETLKMRNDGTIYEIGKKPLSINEIEGQFMGLVKFSQNGIKQIKKIWHKAVKEGSLLNKPVENVYMTDLLQAIIDSGFLINSVPVFGGWVEIDTIDDLNSPTTLNRISSIK